MLVFTGRSLVNQLSATPRRLLDWTGLQTAPARKLEFSFSFVTPPTSGWRALPNHYNHCPRLLTEKNLSHIMKGQTRIHRKEVFTNPLLTAVFPVLLALRTSWVLDPYCWPGVCTELSPRKGDLIHAQRGLEAPTRSSVCTTCRSLKECLGPFEKRYGPYLPMFGDVTIVYVHSRCGSQNVSEGGLSLSVMTS